MMVDTMRVYVLMVEECGVYYVENVYLNKEDADKRLKVIQERDCITDYYIYFFDVEV